MQQGARFDELNSSRSVSHGNERRPDFSGLRNGPADGKRYRRIATPETAAFSLRMATPETAALSALIATPDTAAFSLRMATPDTAAFSLRMATPETAALS